jgi:hypothetical protein
VPSHAPPSSAIFRFQQFGLESDLLQPFRAPPTTSISACFRAFFLIYFTPNVLLLADFLSTLLAGRLGRTILRAFQLKHEVACLTEWTSLPAIRKAFQ